MPRRSNRLTVEEALKILAKADPKAILVVPGSDHSYRTATLEITTAAVYPDDPQIDEDYGPEHNGDGAISVPAVLIQ